MSNGAIRTDHWVHTWHCQLTYSYRVYASLAYALHRYVCQWMCFRYVILRCDEVSVMLVYECDNGLDYDCACVYMRLG